MSASGILHYEVINGRTPCRFRHFCVRHHILPQSSCKSNSKSECTTQNLLPEILIAPNLRNIESSSCIITAGKRNTFEVVVMRNYSDKDFQLSTPGACVVVRGTANKCGFWMDMIGKDKPASSESQRARCLLECWTVVYNVLHEGGIYYEKINKFMNKYGALHWPKFSKAMLGNIQSECKNLPVFCVKPKRDARTREQAFCVDPTNAGNNTGYVRDHVYALQDLFCRAQL